jgi:hypothetical protein
MDKDLTIKLEELEYADILWVRCSAGMTWGTEFGIEDTIADEDVQEACIIINGENKIVKVEK